MGLKKGIFFALDSFIALIFFIIIVTTIYSFFLTSHSLNQQYYLSEDLLNTFSSVKINELDRSKYPLKNPISNAELPLENQEFTIMEQIASFEEQDLKTDPETGTNCGIIHNGKCARYLINDLTQNNLFPVQYEFDVEIIGSIYPEKQPQIDIAKALVTRGKRVPTPEEA